MKVRYYCEKCGKEQPDRSQFYTADVVISRAIQAEYRNYNDLDTSHAWDLCRQCADNLNHAVNTWKDKP